MADFPIIGPEDDIVKMEIVGAGVTLDRWVEYSFNNNFLVPTDAFSFTVAGDQINKLNRSVIVPGANVRCKVNGSIQIDARIDSVTYRVSRSGGVSMVISGRDKIAALVDSGIDPLLRFNPKMTLLQFLAEVFGPFGYGEANFEIQNDDNVGIMAKNVYGVKTRKSDVSKKSAGKPLASYQLHQCRPYPNEGAFAFATRICQREGLWLWLQADGKKIVVSKPRYDQSPVYSLERQFNGVNNILSGDVSYDVGEQPSIIIADGFSGGNEFGMSRMRAYVENPMLEVDNSAALKKYAQAGMEKVIIPFFGKKIPLPTAKPMFLHDDEAKTPVQLHNYVLREMSLRLRRGLSIHFTVKGHHQKGTNWAVDTICHVTDEVSGLDEDLWILARTFRKSRSGGTTTDLEMIRPHSLTF